MILWSPEGRPSEMRRFAERHGFDDYEALQRWSVDRPRRLLARGGGLLRAAARAGPVLATPRDAGRAVVPGGEAQLRVHMLPESDDVA